MAGGMRLARTPILLIFCFAGTAAAARMPQSAEAHTALGVTLAEHGDTAGAIRELEQAVQLDGGSAEAFYNLGATWIKKAKEAPGSGLGRLLCGPG